MHWCRDVDWGTAPQWVSAGAALLAVVLSAIGVGVATSTFRRNVKDARVSQARKVFAVHAQKAVEAGGVADVREGYTEKGTLGMLVANGKGFQTREHVNVVKVTVHNNSDEPVSNLAVQVATETVDWYPTNAGYVIAAVTPGSKYVVDFVTIDQAATGASTQVLDFEVTLTFTDSVGKHWTRTDAQPVKEIKKNDYRPRLGPGLIDLDRRQPFNL